MEKEPEVVMQHLDEGTIHAWLDGALSPDEARQAEEHVAVCADCAAAVAEARGLIAASSMIISKLDGVLGAAEPRADAGSSPMNDIAVARAAADARQRPVRRSWFAAPGLRAAAAVLILAGGVAVVQNVTGREELARVVNDASPEAAVSRQAAAAPGSDEVVAQDATAASAEQAETPPPAPATVGPAPALPRPTQVLGGVTPREEAPRGMVGDVSGVLAGAETGADRRGISPTAALSVTVEGSAARAAAGQGAAAENQRAELRQERDLTTSAKTAAVSPPAANLAAPAPVTPAPAEVSPTSAPADGAASARADARQFADSTVLLRERRRQAEEGAAPQQRFTPPAGRARMAPAPTAALADAFGAAAECYALTLSPWRPEQSVIPGAPATRIALSADTGTAGPAKGHRLVRPLPGAFAGSYEHAWYTEVSPATLVLTWATGSEGIVMRLVRSGDTVRGTARTFGTTGTIEQTSTVTGERVGCGDVR